MIDLTAVTAVSRHLSTLTLFDITLMEKAYLRYREKIRFERFRSIISFGFCNLFFVEISNIRLTLHTQMFR